MGMEYRITFTGGDTTQVDGFLRSLPSFVEFDEMRAVYRYKEDNNLGEMPSVEINVEDGGFYLCDYGASKNLIGIMVTKFVSRFGRVEIGDYE